MEVSSSCEQCVCRRVQTCFARVLNYADDEANTYNLHCYIVGDTKQRASQRNQQQGTTCNTGSTASGDSCYEGQQNLHCKGNFHAQCVYASQCHNCDCDCSTAHVDGCTQRDRDGVVIFIQTQFFTQSHVNRDIRCGRSCEECCDKGILQAFEYQRIRVGFDLCPYDDGVQNQSYESHAANQNCQNLTVFCEDTQTVFGYCCEYQTQDTEGSAGDYCSNCCCNCFGEIVQCFLCCVTCFFQCQTKDNSPEQNTQVVCVYHGTDGVGNNVVQQIGEYFTNAACCCVAICGSSVAQRQNDVDEVASQYSNNSRCECTNQVQCNYTAHCSAAALLTASQSCDNQEEYQNRCYSLQSTNEQGTQNTDNFYLWNQQTKDCTNDQTTNDTFY